MKDRMPRTGLPSTRFTAVWAVVFSLILQTCGRCVSAQGAFDFEYFVSQVGIDTTLQNAWNSQLYQQELCDEFLNYAPGSFAGEISGGLYSKSSGSNVNATAVPSPQVLFEPDHLGRPFEGYKVNFDFNSQRAQRSLVVSGTKIAIGGKDPSNPASVGSFTFTGSVQATAPGSVNGGFYFFWIWTTLCNTDSARVSLNIPQFTVTIAIDSTSTPGQYTLNPQCNAPIDASDVVFSGCSGRILGWLEPGIIQDQVIPSLQAFICPQLQTLIMQDLQSWLTPNQVINIDGSTLSVQYTTNSLIFEEASSVTIQAAMEFLVKQPDGTQLAFGQHRPSPLPSSWPVTPGLNSTTSAVSISREAIANFIAAANAGGYLNFNGTFDVYETHLYVNGSIENTSVVFPAGGIHAHMQVHEVFMFLHIHCDAYTGFKIFDVALSHVTEVGQVSCDSWTSGITMEFSDLNIHNASMEGLSTSLELPPELLKPLVVKGVNYALPVINEALKGLAFTFPDKVKWLAPLAPNPVTWTVGSSATEEGHISVIWSCACGEHVNATMRCAGNFCPSEDGSAVDPIVAPRGAFPAAPETFTGIGDGGCNAMARPIEFNTLGNSSGNSSDPGHLCLSIMKFPSTDCLPASDGQNVSVAHVCVPAVENTTCFNMTDSSIFLELFGPFANIFVESPNASTITVGTDCIHIPNTAQCGYCRATDVVDLRTCAKGLMIVPTFLNGSVDCGTDFDTDFSNSSLSIVVEFVGSSGQAWASTRPVDRRYNNGGSNSTPKDAWLQLESPLLNAERGNLDAEGLALAPPNVTIQPPQVSTVFVVPTAPGSEPSLTAPCLPCATDAIATLVGTSDLYCQVLMTTPKFAGGNFFCTSSDCDSSTCFKPQFTAFYGMQYLLPITPSRNVTNGTTSDEVLFSVTVPTLVATCLPPSPEFLGLPLWIVIITFALGCIVLVTIAAIAHAQIVARRRRLLLEAGGQEFADANEVSPCAEFHGGALIAACIGYVVALGALLYAWTYTNPAKMQSDSLVHHMSYAQSNSTNSTFGINFSLVGAQMDSFVDTGQRVLLGVVAASFAVVAFSSIDWRRYRLARVLGLAPLLLMPLFGFGVFMARSNWLSVVYMGSSPSGPAEGQSTIAAVLSAVWLESVVVTTASALSNTLVAIPLGSIGTLLLVDDMAMVGWSLSGAEWTAWVPSLVTVEMVCALLALLIKLVLLVTGFEDDASAMFVSFAMLTGVPMGALALLGGARCMRSAPRLERLPCLPLARVFVVRATGLALLFGGAYALVFDFGDAGAVLDNLEGVLWNLVCVVITICSSACMTVELLLLSNEPGTSDVDVDRSHGHHGVRHIRKKKKPARPPVAVAGSLALEDVSSAAFIATDDDDFTHEESALRQLVAQANAANGTATLQYLSLVWTLDAEEQPTSADREACAESPPPKCSALRRFLCRLLSAARIVAEFFLEIVNWLAEEGPYKAKDKILFRRGSAVVAAIPLFFVAASTYSAVCAPYGFASIFTLSEDQLFNCSYDELVQELSNYSNATVTLDRSPDSAFYSIIQLRARDMLKGAQLGMLGVALFFLMAIASMIEGLEVPVLRARKYFLTVILNRPHVEISARWKALLQRLSRIVLVISRLLGIAAVAVLCISTFTPYTLSYSQLLHITCNCEGKFCDMVDQTVTAMFQNLQLSSLAQEIFILSISIPWTLGRIAYFVHLDVAAEAARKREEAASDSRQGRSHPIVANDGGHASVAAQTAAEATTMNNVVWVTFGCTVVFMLFTGSLIGVLAAVSGEDAAVWIVGLFLLGGVTPLFAILFDAATCAAASRNTRLGTMCAAFLVMVLVPAAVLVCFEASGDPGPWDYLSFLAIVAYSASIFASVIWPNLRAMFSRRQPSTGTSHAARRGFDAAPAAQYNTVTNFFALFSMVGASIYCVAMKLWEPAPIACAVIVAVFVVLLSFVGVSLFCTCLCRLPDKILKIPLQTVAEELTGHAAPASDNNTVDSDSTANELMEAWVALRLRRARVPHTELIRVSLAQKDSGEAGESTPADVHSQAPAPSPTTTNDPTFEDDSEGNWVATVHVTKHSGRTLFRAIQLTQPLRAFFANKTLFLYMSWGDAWFLFSILYILAKVSLHASASFAAEYLNVREDQPTFSLLQEILSSLFTAEEWPSTLAEFFGADVILTDIIFGAMVLARLCKGGTRDTRTGRYFRNEESTDPSGVEASTEVLSHDAGNNANGAVGPTNAAPGDARHATPAASAAAELRAERCRLLEKERELEELRERIRRKQAELEQPLLQ